MNVQKIIKHPVSWIATTVSGAALAIFNPAVITGLIDATLINLDALFSLLLIAGLRLPQFWPPSSNFEWFILAIGGALVLQIAYRIWQTYDREIDEETQQ